MTTSISLSHGVLGIALVSAALGQGDGDGVGVADGTAVEVVVVSASPRGVDHDGDAAGGLTFRIVAGGRRRARGCSRVLGITERVVGGAAHRREGEGKNKCPALQAAGLEVLSTKGVMDSS